jgi:selenocysteine lyase/cysteine desulfurase
MDATRRRFLAASTALLATPGGLLAAVAAQSKPLPPLDTWDAVRATFRLTPKYRHFAGFYLASHPTPVRDAIDAFRAALDANPFLTVEHGLFGDEAGNLQLAVCREAAAYLGGTADRIALTPNTTTGLALVYHGLALAPGDELLTTTHDHYAHHESIRLAARRHGATVRKVALYDDATTATAGAIVDRLRAAVGPKTRAVGVTWVHSSTGLRLPIPALRAALDEINASRPPAERALLVVDGVHGLGAVDATIAELGADVFCAGTHKWLFAPRGTGLVWAQPAAWARIEPVIPTFSDFEVYDAWMDGRLPSGPNVAARVSPGGFHAYEHQWAMAAAFRLHATIGRGRAGARIAELNSRIKAGLAEIPKVKQRTPRDPGLSAGLCCFEIDGMTPDEAVKRLLDRGVVASTSPYAVSYVRLAAGLMNSVEDVDVAVAAVRAIAA